MFTSQVAVQAVYNCITSSHGICLPKFVYHHLYITMFTILDQLLLSQWNTLPVFVVGAATKDQGILLLMVTQKYCPFFYGDLNNSTVMRFSPQFYCQLQ